MHRDFEGVEANIRYDIKFQEEPIAYDENEYNTIKGWDDDGGYHSLNFGIYHGNGVLGDLAGTADKDQNP